MKTKLIALFLLLFVGLTVQTQAQDYTIEYEMDMKGGDLDPQAAAMMEGMTMKMMFKDTKVRVETDMSMGKTTAIVDAENKEGVALMDMMGMKMAVPMGADEFNQAEEQETPDINWTGKTKKIAGYLCSQAIMKDDGGEVEMWVAKDIQVNAAGTDFDYGDIGGFPLQMDVDQDGTKIKMMATDVSTKKLNSDLFDVVIPSGYMEMTPEMMKSMGGGR